MRINLGRLLFIYPDDGGRNFFRNVDIYTRLHGVTPPKTSYNSDLEQANYEKLLKFAAVNNSLIFMIPA
jgi:hypothetical protein